MNTGTVVSVEFWYAVVDPYGVGAPVTLSPSGRSAFTSRGRCAVCDHTGIVVKVEFAEAGKELDPGGTAKNALST